MQTLVQWQPQPPKERPPEESAAADRETAGSQPPALPYWIGPADMGPELLCADTADAAVPQGLPMPRYRWQERDDGGAILEVLEPSADADVEVDMSETMVRLSWGACVLAVPPEFQGDSEACVLQRKRRRRLLILSIPPVLAAPPSLRSPVELLAAALESPEGHGFVDGFLGGLEADRLRQGLLRLWRAGRMDPGEVEGDEDVTNPNRARSDEHLYAEDGDVEIMSFARRLDRVIVEVARRVPGLRTYKLMRGRPMAAIYAGTGSRYTPHFDCVGGDNGRVITCIIYLNPFWKQGDGATLKLWPEARSLHPSGPCREVEPYHGRLAAFLCDSRNLHEVSPIAAAGAGGRAPEPRLALSCWYYDADAIPRVAEEQAAKDAPS
mmetsp:Transcript_24377/g.78745  ORF Transcript_24377/g.78745 Transcript_24377/m.78745 type:complete len:381 (-) Transcript_24377:95-1237(-)